MPRAVDIVQWRRIAATLRQRIADGTYPVGEQLPSQGALAKELGAKTTNPVRVALDKLAAEGLVDGSQGVRAVVLRVPNLEEPPPSEATLLERFTQVLDRLEDLTQRVVALERERSAEPKKERRPSR